MKEEEEEVIEYEIPLMWGCYLFIGFLLVFALAIVLIVGWLM